MSIHGEMDRVIAEITECARDPFVERHIGRPNTSAFFVKVLYLLLKSYSLPSERIRLHCVATALLQMGLDLHERVSVEPERAEQGMRSRQLFVLAGDYFSSLFYRFLAEKGEIQTISRLSEAVCEVNEAKMELYALAGRRQVSPPTYLGFIRRIRGSLPSALSDLFHRGKTSDNPWRDLAPDLAVLDWLADADAGYPGVPSVLRSGEMRLDLIRTTVSAVRQKAAAIAHPEVRRELLRMVSEHFDSYLTEPLAREG
jgi:heptaprenyl diphosphate synthase